MCTRCAKNFKNTSRRDLWCPGKLGGSRRESGNSPGTPSRPNLMCLALWCLGLILGWNLRRGFISKLKMVKTRRARSKIHESTVGCSSCSSPWDSWNHPSPTDHICSQDELSQRRQRVRSAQAILHTPHGSTTRPRAGGEGIQRSS